MSNRTISLIIILSALSAACADTPSTGPTPAGSVIAAQSGSGTGGASRIISEASLVAPADGAFRGANGKAKWEQRDAMQRELQIEVEDVTPGTQVNFFVGGIQFGATQTVDGLGSARIDLNSQNGDQVPTSVSGQRVEARTPGDVLIAAGTFK